MQSNASKVQPILPRDAAHNKNEGSVSLGPNTPQSGNFVNTIRERAEREEETPERAFQRRRRIKEGNKAACWREELLREQERKYAPHIIFGAVDEAGSFPPATEL